MLRAVVDDGGGARRLFPVVEATAVVVVVVIVVRFPRMSLDEPMVGGIGTGIGTSSSLFSSLQYCCLFCMHIYRGNMQITIQFWAQ